MYLSTALSNLCPELETPANILSPHTSLAGEHGCEATPSYVRKALTNSPTHKHGSLVSIRLHSSPHPAEHVTSSTYSAWGFARSQGPGASASRRVGWHVPDYLKYKYEYTRVHVFIYTQNYEHMCVYIYM